MKFNMTHNFFYHPKREAVFNNMVCFVFQSFGPLNSKSESSNTLILPPHVNQPLRRLSRTFALCASQLSGGGGLGWPLL